LDQFSPCFIMRNFWNLKASIYHFFRMIPGVRWILVQEKGNLRKLLPPEIDTVQAILDIGSGSGSTLDIFPEKLMIVAVDQSAAMLIQTLKRRPGTVAVVASADALPFKSSVFQFCSCIGVTEYFSRPDIPLAEMNRILTDSGQLLITFPNRSLVNYLRLILGHSIYPQNASWKLLLNKSRFHPDKKAQSWLQTQILAKIH
jgi:ubiquinone/menaquinone biosynthesis C-methylase UbiE